MGGREWAPCGVARGPGQDVGTARVSPVSTRGFPDTCPGIVCWRMSHLRSPWVPPFPAPLACPTLFFLPAHCGAARAQLSHCWPPVDWGRGSTAPWAGRLAGVCLGSLLGPGTPTKEAMSFGASGQARLIRMLGRRWLLCPTPSRLLRGACGSLATGLLRSES